MLMEELRRRRLTPERIIEEIKAERKLKHNSYCFDCGNRGPTYINTTVYTFVCNTCSGVLRSLNHRLKSISVSSFTLEELAGVIAGGNEAARRTWMANYVPGSYRRPTPGDEKALLDFMTQVYVKKRWLKDDESVVKAKSSSKSKAASKSSKKKVVSEEDEEEEEETEESSESSVEAPPVVKTVKKTTPKKKKAAVKPKKKVQEESDEGSEEEEVEEVATPKLSPPRENPRSKKNVKPALTKQKTESSIKSSKAAKPVMSKQKTIATELDLMDAVIESPVIEEKEELDLLDFTTFSISAPAKKEEPVETLIPDVTQSPAGQPTPSPRGFLPFVAAAPPAHQQFGIPNSAAFSHGAAVPQARPAQPAYAVPHATYGHAPQPAYGQVPQPGYGQVPHMVGYHPQFTPQAAPPTAPSQALVVVPDLNAPMQPPQGQYPGHMPYHPGMMYPMYYPPQMPYGQPHPGMPYAGYNMHAHHNVEAAVASYLAKEQPAAPEAPTAMNINPAEAEFKPAPKPKKFDWSRYELNAEEEVTEGTESNMNAEVDSDATGFVADPFGEIMSSHSFNPAPAPSFPRAEPDLMNFSAQPVEGHHNLSSAQFAERHEISSKSSGLSMPLDPLPQSDSSYEDPFAAVGTAPAFGSPKPVYHVEVTPAAEENSYGQRDEGSLWAANVPKQSAPLPQEGYNWNPAPVQTSHEYAKPAIAQPLYLNPAAPTTSWARPGAASPSRTQYGGGDDIFGENPNPFA